MLIPLARVGPDLAYSTIPNSPIPDPQSQQDGQTNQRYREQETDDEPIDANRRRMPAESRANAVRQTQAVVINNREVTAEQDQQSRRARPQHRTQQELPSPPHRGENVAEFDGSPNPPDSSSAYRSHPDSAYAGRAK